MSRCDRNSSEPPAGVSTRIPARAIHHGLGNPEPLLGMVFEMAENHALLRTMDPLLAEHAVSLQLDLVEGIVTVHGTVERCLQEPAGTHRTTIRFQRAGPEEHALLRTHFAGPSPTG